MEKKGDVLNQLAIISDLLERANLTSESITVAFTLKPDEMKRMADEVSKKTKLYTEDMAINFNLKIGEIEFTFSAAKTT